MSRSSLSLPPLDGRSSSTGSSSNGGGSDAMKLYHALMEKFEDQKKELSNRAITIKTLQRNFEKISVLCKQQSQSLQESREREEEAEAAKRDLEGTIEAYKERVEQLESSRPSDNTAKQIKKLEEALKAAKQRAAAAEAATEGKIAKDGKVEKLAGRY
uniref:Uncharacterized protein n=1 Tax=Palpitomonas bilix TaxID=652834 RepID=A0A7S3G3I9_9EUKA|mmetsp:Transcript_1602/g.3268  ORF Transcript_1602/g.3268 Transcript_1602/m.3268 type:complete len:158 (+) Transcript_1602:173-646(+)